MMTASIPFCRVNGLFAHYTFEEVAPESFRGEPVREKHHVRHLRGPLAFPIQFNHMLVAADQLPAMQDCVLRMRRRDDLGTTNVTLTLKRPALTRTELELTKLTPQELPAKLDVTVWMVGPNDDLKPLSALLAKAALKPELPESFVKSVFMHAWLEASRHHKVKDKPVWMEARGAFLPGHDTLLVYDPKGGLLGDCKSLVRA